MCLPITLLHINKMKTKLNLSKKVLFLIDRLFFKKRTHLDFLLLIFLIAMIINAR